MYKVYKIRIHHIPADISMFKDSLFLVEELDANRPHWQGIYRTETALATLRTAFKRKNPNHIGNASYSITQMRNTEEDINTYAQYLSKGPDKASKKPVSIVKNTFFSPEDIDKFHDQYWEVAKAYKDQVKEKKQTPIIDSILKEYPIVFNDNQYDISRVVTTVIQYHVDKKKIINENNIKAISNLILARQSEKFKSNLISKIVSSITSQR